MAGVAAAVLLASALAASAQSPGPSDYGNTGPASAAPAVAASTAAVSASTGAVVAVSTAAVKVAGAVKPAVPRLIHAIIPAEAKDWEPVSLRAGGDPVRTATSATLRQVKVKGQFRGVASKATATARLRRRKDDRWLVIAIYPKACEKRRRHFEVRFRVVEGYVDNVEVAMITVVDRRYLGTGMDSVELARRGVEFEEDSPASGSLLVTALDPRPSQGAFNAGTLRRAAFADETAGLVGLSWSTWGLPLEK